MKISRLALSVSAALSILTLPLNALADNVDVETIIITGQKIDRSLQETKNSVAVVTAEDFETYAVRDISDVFDIMPNVHGTLNDGFSIRGIDSFNVSGGGNSFLTSMYFDGAPIPYRLMRQGSLSMWDVSQVEVFRGPQSTIQGRNALAGAIIIRSQDPSYEPSAKFQVVTGQHGQQEYAAAGGGELIENQVAVHLSAEKKEFDGYNFNPTRGENSDFINTENYRAKVLYEPTFIDNFSALFTYTHNKSDIGSRSVNTDKADGPREVYFNSPIVEFTDSDIYNAEISYEINDNWDFDSITTFSEVDYGYLWDGDGTAQDISTLHYDRADETFSQEFRFTYTNDNLEGVIGLYFSDLDVSDKAGGNRSISLVSLGLPTLLVAPAEYGGLGLPQAFADQVLSLYQPVDPVRLSTNSSLSQAVKSTAIFSDFTYTINDMWSVIAGIRFDKETQKNGSNSLYTISNAELLPDPTFYGAIDPALGQLVGGLNQMLQAQADSASGVAPVSDADFDAWLPKLGVNHNLSDDVSISVIYQKGYRSGGVGTNIAQAKVFTYDPEYTDNYELSLRSVWLDGSLVFNANAFFLDWQKQQVSIQLSSNQYDTETFNAGASEVKGFETELFYFPNEHLTITAGLGLAKTAFTDFQYTVVENTVDLAGRRFADSPEKTANIAVSYDFESGFYINANANYSDSSNAYLNPEVSLDNFKFGVDKEPVNEGRTLVNLQLGYQNEKYKAFISVKNLLDENYIEQFFRPADNASEVPQVNLGEPRQISFTVQANF